MPRAKCDWITCVHNRESFCNAEEIELKEMGGVNEDGESYEGLDCTNFEFDPDYDKR